MLCGGCVVGGMRFCWCTRPGAPPGSVPCSWMPGCQMPCSCWRPGALPTSLPAHPTHATHPSAAALLPPSHSLSGASPSLTCTERESSLKHQTRVVRCYPDGTGYALGSIEGRVAMEFFEDVVPDAAARRYAFKCHRSPAAAGGGDVVHPVNALAFHPTYGTFASGGSDAAVATWDGVQKKRLQMTHGYPTSIAALAFNRAGTILAVAASYCFEQVQTGEGKGEKRRRPRRCGI